MGNFTIIQVNPEDIDKYKDIIVDLWKKNLSNGSDERFEWLYKKNPLGPAVTWLAKLEATGEFVGCNSVYPREIIVNGRRFKMGIVIDFAVNKQYRVFGPALQIEKSIVLNSKAAGFDFIFAWPSPASIGVFTRAGYKAIGEVTHYVKLLKTEDKVIKIVKIPLLAKCLSFFTDIYLNLPGLLLRTLKSPKLQTESVKSCSPKIEDLWKIIAADEGIITDKSYSFFNWRYSQCKYEQYFFFNLFDKKDNSMKGVIVYSFSNKSVLVWDIIYLNSRFLGFLINEFACSMLKQKFLNIYITALKNKEFEKDLERYCFFKKIIKRPGVIFSDNNSLLTELEAAVKLDRWRFVDGDMDL